MMLTLECSTKDGTEIQLWPLSAQNGLVGVDMHDHSVYLTEEQTTTLIQYLEALIVGGSHAE